METETDRKSGVILFLFLFLTITSLSFASNVISEGDVLYQNSTVISPQEVFEMGFFAPPSSDKFYFGIRYRKLEDRDIVWVANRDNPISASSSLKLKIADGNLAVFDESKIPVWSTDAKKSTVRAKLQAELLDTGNLILNEVGSEPLKPLWQSFDHPSHTWLPGAKIGYNNVTKTSTVLTSWKSSSNPAKGLFSLGLDPSDDSLLMEWNGSRRFWTSGPCDGRLFSLAPEIRRDNVYNFRVVSDENGTHIVYSVEAENASVAAMSRIVMDVSGQLKQLNYRPPRGWDSLWSQPSKRCEVYAFCGAYGICSENREPNCRCFSGFVRSSLGCARSRQSLECKQDGFVKIYVVSLPEKKDFVESVSLGECNSSCLNNCSCTAYTYNDNGCFVWRGDLFNLNELAGGDNSGSALYVRVGPSELRGFEGNSRGSKRRALLLGIVVPIAAVILASCAICSVCYMRREKTEADKQVNKRRSIQQNHAVQMYDAEKHIADFVVLDQFKEDERKCIEVPFIDLKSILAATNNFSETNKLGQGGFGHVYKGEFRGGKEIAVKRLSSCSGQGLQEFRNEVVLIAKLQHRNLVRLLGYCVEGDEKMLLYEYMPNKSLDLFIFDRKQCVSLSWDFRFNIILGIARGLHYLHHDSRLRIIHRDLKTSNVLLDEDMNPKISDFGLAKIVEGKQTEASTNRVVGTYGYMSPEYASHGLFSIKSDVFSFGVVVLEIISGRRNTGFYNSEQALSLLDYAWKLWKEKRARDLMDDRTLIDETCDASREFLRCFNVGLLCVQDDPGDRPTMSSALIMLGSETGALPSPKQPAFVVKRSLSSRAHDNDEPNSSNNLTDTLYEGR